MNRIHTAALSIFAILCVFECRGVAQPAPASPSDGAVSSDMSEVTDTSLETTLVILKSNWSKSASAKAIEADLAAALEDTPKADLLRKKRPTDGMDRGSMYGEEGVGGNFEEAAKYDSADQMEEEYYSSYSTEEYESYGMGHDDHRSLPSFASVGPRLLFPYHSAAVYRPDNLDVMMAWLRKHKLIKSVTKGKALDSAPCPGGEVVVDHQASSFCLNEETIPMPPFLRQLQPEDLFVSRKVRWWCHYSRTGRQVTATRFSSWIEQRRISTARVDERMIGIPYCAKATFDLPRDRVVVVNWFLLSDFDKTTRNYARQQGVEAIVLVRDPKTRLRFLDEPDSQVTPQLRIADGFGPVTVPHHQLSSDDQPQPKRDTGVATDEQADTTLRPTPSAAEPQRGDLLENYQQLERQAASVAEQHRELSSKPTSANATALKRQLTDIVRQAFETRQKLQRAQVDVFRQRLADIEQRIAARERIKATIIDRRVDELLDPNLTLSSETVPSPQGSDSGTRYTGTTEQPSPLILQSAGELAGKLSSAEMQLKQILLEQGNGTVNANTVEACRQHLTWIRTEYAAQMRLLELELTAAEEAVLLAEDKFENATKTNKMVPNTVPETTLKELSHAVALAKLRVDRVHTLLDLYRRAGQINQSPPESSSAVIPTEPPPARSSNSPGGPDRSAADSKK